MTDHPIIFSASMILALLREAEKPGTGKTMTRRIAWRSETDRQKMSFVCDGERPNPLARKAKGFTPMAGDYWLRPTPWVSVKPGDRLWVRENFWAFGRWRRGRKAVKSFYKFEQLHRDTIYAADAATERLVVKGKFGQANPPAWYLRPNIFLPKAESRLTLVVTGTKIERLQQITEEDARAEGVQHRWLKSAACAPRSLYFIDAGDREHSGPFAVSAFEMLWVDLHGATAWDENPEVVALSFSVHAGNIENIREAA